MFLNKFNVKQVYMYSSGMRTANFGAAIPGVMSGGGEYPPLPGQVQCLGGEYQGMGNWG